MSFTFAMKSPTPGVLGDFIKSSGIAKNVSIVSKEKRKKSSSWLHVVIFWVFLYQFEAQCMDLYETRGNFHEVLNMNELFVRCDRFIWDLGLSSTVGEGGIG